jgi:hypothetical protein
MAAGSGTPTLPPVRLMSSVVVYSILESCQRCKLASARAWEENVLVNVRVGDARDRYLGEHHGPATWSARVHSHRLPVEDSPKDVEAWTVYVVCGAGGRGLITHCQRCDDEV